MTWIPFLRPRFYTKLLSEVVASILSQRHTGLALAYLPSRLTAGEGLGLDIARSGAVLIWISQVMYIATGGYAVIQHYIIRRIFQRAGVIPSNYAQFLDYAATLILLRKVGGGYIFTHRYLLEYFAAQLYVVRTNGAEKRSMLRDAISEITN